MTELDPPLCLTCLDVEWLTVEIESDDGRIVEQRMRCPDCS